MACVIVDANVLINFLIADKVELLASLPGCTFIVPPEVVAEVKRPAQARTLAQEFEAGTLQRLDAMTPQELEAQIHLNDRFGSGESACLAVAEARNWFLACDEKRTFRNEAIRRIGRARLLSTPSLLVRSIREGIIGIDEADKVKLALEKARFRMIFSSFRDLPGVEQ